MNIRDRRAIHETAAHVLDRAKEARRIVLVYGIICCGLSLAATIVSALLGDRISGTGGLGNIGIRSVLSTVQSVLPLANLIVTACLSLGYHTAMLCFTRGFDASTDTLMSGFRHFGAVIRTMLLQAAVYVGAGFLALNLSAFIFTASPLAADFNALMEPILGSVTVMDSSVVLDEATLMAVGESMIPMLWIMLAVSLVLMVPLHYRFRMVNFSLADDPRLGAIHALSKSRRMMRRNCFALFRLDLSLWWFYAAQTLISLVCYGDILLPMVGVDFPWSSEVSYYLFLVLSLGMQIGLYYFGMNRVYGAYAVAYDVLQEDLPKPEYPVQM